MSLYADYLKERTNDCIIEGPSGFVTYRLFPNDKTVYVVDIYTVPEERKGGAASKLADLVAEECKKQGYTSMMGTVVPSAKGSTIGMKVLLAYGMEVQSASNDVVVFRKEL